MFKPAASLGGICVFALMLGCGTPAPVDSSPGGGASGGTRGSSASGGSTSSTGGKAGSATGGATGGSDSAGGAGGATGGNSGGSIGQGGDQGGQGGQGQGAGGAPATDAADEDSGAAPDTSTGAGGSTPPSSGDQGPVAGGKIVFSQDFEQNMNGTSRSPTSLPADRIQIVDDPAMQRGKVVQITYKAGDDFRTSAGTQPRSWLSSAMGYSAKAGTTVSVSFGFMTDNPSWGAHFGQIIRDGGPLWMLLLATDGSVAAEVHRGSGGGKAGEKIVANKWYDFRIDTTYSAGGAIKFFMNGKMIGSGTGAGGGNGRFDCGIYWYNGPKQTRNAWISNISIGEL